MEITPLSAKHKYATRAYIKKVHKSVGSGTAVWIIVQTSIGKMYNFTLYALCHCQPIYELFSP